MRDKNKYWAWAILNGIITICWTGLAIYFGKWWMALFAGLFVYGIKSRE